MKETTTTTYCDILSEHSNQKVSGASPVEITVMAQDPKTQNFYPKKVVVDMCAACYAKYESNLNFIYNQFGKPSYVFASEQQ